MLNHWPATSILLGLVILLGAFALMARWYAQKDEAARLSTYRRAEPASVRRAGSR